MSKQSKIFGTRNNFEICFVPKPQSQMVMPNSAEKGKSFYETQHLDRKAKVSKSKQEEEFYLEHRDKRQSNSFLGFYRMKSLTFPISHLSAQHLKSFKVLGTMDKKIIVAFNIKLQIFCFFDQHAMHERIRYQYYLEGLSAHDNPNCKQKPWNFSIIQKTGKNIPIVSGAKHCYTSIRVSRQLDLQIAEDSVFERYGFQVEYLKKDMILKVNKVPLILQRPLDNKLILGIAYDIILQKPNLPKCFQSIIAEISCKSAYKFNDVIQKSVINELISNLSLCQYPFFCVHGRPTLFTKI